MPRMKHGLNTDQDGEQGQEESSEISERECVTVSTLGLGPGYYPWQKPVVRHSRPPLLLVFQFTASCPDPSSIRVSSVAKIFPEVTSLDLRMSQQKSH